MDIEDIELCATAARELRRFANGYRMRARVAMCTMIVLTYTSIAVSMQWPDNLRQMIIVTMYIYMQ